MDRTWDAIEERHDPHLLAHRLESGESDLSGLVVGHPVRLRRTTVKTVTGVSGPHRAIAAIDRCTRLRCVGERDDDRGLPCDAGAVPERVDHHLVLERDPFGSAVGNEWTAGQVRVRVEERAEHERVAIGIELVECEDHLGRRVGEKAIVGTELLHDRQARRCLDDDGCHVGSFAGTPPVCDDEHVGDADGPQGRQMLGPGSGIGASEDDASATENRSQRRGPPVVHQRTVGVVGPQGERVSGIRLRFARS